MTKRKTALTYDDLMFMRELRHELELSARRHYQELTQREVVDTAGWHVSVEGHESRDMYDHAPGVAYFTVDASQGVYISGFKTATEIKDAALAAFEECRLQLALCPEEHDGMFMPMRVVIRDHHGVVAKYQNGAWQEPSLPSEVWLEVEAQIEALNKEAAEEARWDNFDTARRLRDKADLLREDLALSRRHHVAEVPF